MFTFLYKTWLFFSSFHVGIDLFLDLCFTLGLDNIKKMSYHDISTIHDVFQDIYGILLTDWQQGGSAVCKKEPV